MNNITIESYVNQVDTYVAELRVQLNERQTLIDAQAAELTKLRAQVAELGVTVEELQAMLRERNWDVDRKNAMIAERDATIRGMLLDARIINDELRSLRAWVNEAKDAARGILGYVPEGTDVDADYDKLHELLLDCPVEEHMTPPPRP